jgi:hypothetical protein
VCIPFSSLFDLLCIVPALVVFFGWPFWRWRDQQKPQGKKEKKKVDLRFCCERPKSAFAAEPRQRSEDLSPLLWVVVVVLGTACNAASTRNFSTKSGTPFTHSLAHLHQRETHIPHSAEVKQTPANKHTKRNTQTKKKEIECVVLQREKKHGA